MTGIDRRTAALIAMLTPFAGRQAFAAGAGQPTARPPEEPQAVPANWVRPDMIAMLVYPGMTAGIDFGLSMVAELRDAHYARCTQLVAEYDPHPPFDAGSVHRAPREVRDSMTAMFAPFVSEARALARRRG